MNRKTEFTSPRGDREGMLIDCDTYEVKFYKTIDKERYGSQLTFIDKKTKNAVCLSLAFQFDWDKESDGGRLEIKYKDRWGSEMRFINYAPSDLKGMFDFIGKGYDVFKTISNEESFFREIINVFKRRINKIKNK